MLVGTAGWTLPPAVRDRFGEGTSQLARYATRLPCAEINSSFYRPHRRTTYERWAATVPPAFRFAVKIPKTITHARRLAGGEDELDRFLAESAGLGDRRGVLLVQLPPSLAFEGETAARFFSALRERYDGGAACEPRHASWFGAEGDALLAHHRIARVAADPAVVPAAAEPGGWAGLVYVRLHGSPVTYRSPYGEERLRALAGRLGGVAAPVWCIFDNTQFGAATADALAMLAL